MDYIAEHINPATGRAGVIVPEGIIFQSANAYKQLRQLLVDKKFLYAVVSLPAGIFQPYSGVKTSILLMDKTLAKRTDNILFVKIDNDGFDLGAQRRAIDKNDLTAGLVHLQEYKEAVLNNTVFTSNNKNVFVVDKKMIKGTGDYNLSVDCYRMNENVKQSKWEMVRLGDVLKLTSGKFLSQQQMIQGKYPVYGGNGINGFHNEYFIKEPVLLIGRVGAYCGAVHITQPDSWITDNGLYVTEYLKEVDQTFLALLLKNINLNQYSKVGGQPSLSQSSIYELSIPLPPLSIQQKIAAKIENYQAIINGAKQVVQNYKPQIDIDPDWERVELGEVCELIQYGSSAPLNLDVNGFKTFRMNEIFEGIMVDNGSMKCSDLSQVDFKKYKLEKGDILFNRTNSYELVGKTGIFNLDGDYVFASYLIRLKVSKMKANPFYINIYMNTFEFQDGIKQFASRLINVLMRYEK